MSHVKASGSVYQSGNRSGKRLGIKINDGQQVKVGAIIVRQKGTNFYAGVGTKLAKNNNLHALVLGTVKFRKFKHRNGQRVMVSIIPLVA